MQVGEQVGVLTLERRSGTSPWSACSVTAATRTPSAGSTRSRSPSRCRAADARRAGRVQQRRREAATGSPDESCATRGRALGADFEVKTGEQVAAERGRLTEGLSFFNKILLGFAAVALLVGTFLILNTFSIIVAQRTGSWR